MAADYEKSYRDMNFEAQITELQKHFLADTRAPKIEESVDQLFRLAAKHGAVACACEGDKRLRFFVPELSSGTASPVSTATRVRTECVIQHDAAKPILRMICARFAAICNAHAAQSDSPYGDATVVDYEINGHKQWNIAFTNTTDQQEFSIVATC